MWYDVIWCDTTITTTTIYLFYITVRWPVYIVRGRFSVTDWLTDWLVRFPDKEIVIRNLNNIYVYFIEDDWLIWRKEREKVQWSLLTDSIQFIPKETTMSLCGRENGSFSWNVCCSSRNKQRKLGWKECCREFFGRQKGTCGLRVSCVSEWVITHEWVCLQEEAHRDVVDIWMDVSCEFHMNRM